MAREPSCALGARKRLLIALVAAASFLPALPCLGAPLRITPLLELSVEERRALGAQTSVATAALQGAGGRLAMTYTATTPFWLAIAPSAEDGAVDPDDILYAQLPKGGGVQAEIDLTVSPGWSPWKDRYVLSASKSTAGDDTAIDAVSIEPATFGEIAMAVLRHAATREGWYVSAFHVLRGTRLLDVPLAMIVGIATVLAAAIHAVRRTPARTLATPLIAAAIGLGLWTNIELLRWTVLHAKEYAGEGTYGQLGAAKTIGTFVRDLQRTDKRKLALSVCGAGSDYYGKAVRYFSTPVPVDVAGATLALSTHVLVAADAPWAFAPDEGKLRCRDASVGAEAMHTFADGSILFATRP